MQVPHMSSGGRYPVLRAVGILCIVFAGVSILVGLYFAALCFTLPERLPMRLVYAAGSLIGAFVSLVGFLGAAELLKLFMDMERHARHIALRENAEASTPVETREFTKVNRITDLEEETAEAALMRGH